MTQHGLVRAGFIAGGLANIGGVMLATLAFTNPLVAQQYPAVFSDFGMFAIILWGLAYIAVSGSYAAVPWLVAVFALEKAAYVITWLLWMSAHGGTLGSLYGQSFVTGLFYTVYGVNDFAFGVFFAWVFWRTKSPASFAVTP